jgi:ribonuclease P protein component
VLSKTNRFHGYGSLNYVYRKGQTSRSPYCAMKFVPGKYDNYRVSVVVSKKVAKSAPERNRIRRRVYEAIRLNDKSLKNQDIVITIFDDRFLTMPFDELQKSIRRQLRQIAKWS